MEKHILCQEGNGRSLPSFHHTPKGRVYPKRQEETGKIGDTYDENKDIYQSDVGSPMIRSPKKKAQNNLVVTGKVTTFAATN